MPIEFSCVNGDVGPCNEPFDLTKGQVQLVSVDVTQKDIN